MERDSLAGSTMQTEVTDVGEDDEYDGIPEEYVALLREKDETIAALRAEVEEIVVQLMDLQTVETPCTSPASFGGPSTRGFDRSGIDTSHANKSAASMASGGQSVPLMKQLKDEIEFSVNAAKTAEARVEEVEQELAAAQERVAVLQDANASLENALTKERESLSGVAAVRSESCNSGVSGGSDLAAQRLVSALEQQLAQQAERLKACDAEIAQLRGNADPPTLQTVDPFDLAQQPLRRVQSMLGPSSTSARRVVALEKLLAQYVQDLAAKDAALRALEARHAQCSPSARPSARDPAGADEGEVAFLRRVLQATQAELRGVKAARGQPQPLELEEPLDTDTDDSASEGAVSRASFETPWHIRQRRAIDAAGRVDEEEDLHARVLFLQKETFTLKALLAAADANSGAATAEENDARVNELEARLSNVKTDAEQKRVNLDAANRRVAELQADLAKVHRDDAGDADAALRDGLAVALRDAVLAQKEAERDITLLNEQLGHMRTTVAELRKATASVMQQRGTTRASSPFARPGEAKYRGEIAALRRRVKELEAAAAAPQGPHPSPIRAGARL